MAVMRTICLYVHQSKTLQESGFIALSKTTSAPGIWWYQSLRMTYLGFISNISDAPEMVISPSWHSNLTILDQIMPKTWPTGLNCFWRHSHMRVKRGLFFNRYVRSHKEHHEILNGLLQHGYWLIPAQDDIFTIYYMLIGWSPADLCIFIMEEVYLVMYNLERTDYMFATLFPIAVPLLL